MVANYGDDETKVEKILQASPTACNLIDKAIKKFEDDINTSIEYRNMEQVMNRFMQLDTLLSFKQIRCIK